MDVVADLQLTVCLQGVVDSVDFWVDLEGSVAEMLPNSLHWTVTNYQLYSPTGRWTSCSETWISVRVSIDDCAAIAAIHSTAVIAGARSQGCCPRTA